MRILITGGAGYIGSHIARLLREARLAHFVYDDFSTGRRRLIAGSDFVAADITDTAALARAFTQFKPDMVMHLAALATLGDCAHRPDDCRRITIEGTCNLLETMRAHSVRHLVFAGSCAVYADASAGTALRENAPLKPRSVYGKTKQAAEELLAQYAKEHGIQSIALRIFNAAGADPQGRIGEDHTPETHLLPLAIRAVQDGTALDIYGSDYSTTDGTAVRDYVHVSDIAKAFLLAATYLKNDGAGCMLNLGSGTPTSVRQLIAAVERHAGRKIALREKPRRTHDAPWLVADNTAIKKILGWEPKYSALEEIVATAWQWHSDSSYDLAGMKVSARPLLQ